MPDSKIIISDLAVGLGRVGICLRFASRIFIINLYYIMERNILIDLCKLIKSWIVAYRYCKIRISLFILLFIFLILMIKRTKN